MSDKVNYSIVHKEQGNISVQSTIKSFNLDHVTEKDIVSFYSHFSQYAAWDTGLLPVEGSGILSIRTAGIYTQFAYQHKPGLYHVNWAASEGAPATAYYVAQPYRIIICDMKDGNLLGARMFYSPYPITHPSQNLYHVNLPNINCKGYRGNGVGWICLYQNEDWSHLPLNERIVRFIERCSGVETYNDANMSETDGTRFYSENNKPSYLWDPIKWQEKSQEEGYEWTLDESLWIPVLVTSMDSQDKHYSKGQHLTFADALVGDYQAYYHDDVHTKPINAIIRPDKELSPNTVLSFFASSYNNSSKTNSFLNNTFQVSQQVKDKTGSSIFTGSSLVFSPENHNDAQNTNYFTCDCCSDTYDEEEVEKYSDYYGNSVCSSCFEDSYIYIASVSAHFHIESDVITYIETASDYFHTDFDTIVECDNCNTAWAKSGVNQDIKEVYTPDNSSTTICVDCVADYASENSLETHVCQSCTITVLDEDVYEKPVSIPYIDYTTGHPVPSTNIVKYYYCQDCKHKLFVCPCGVKKQSILDDFFKCEKVTMTVPLDNDSEMKVDVIGSCESCINVEYPQDAPPISKFVPVSINNFNAYHSENYKIYPYDKNHAYSYDPLIDYDNPF